LSNLGGEDGEVDGGEALEVLLEKALGIVLADLLSGHGERLRVEMEELLSLFGGYIEY
jgi:hypothetical protein